MGESWGSYSEELPYVHESISYFQSACQYSGLITPKKVGRILYTTLSLAFPLGCGLLGGFFVCLFVFPLVFSLLSVLATVGFITLLQYMKNRGLA